MERVTSDPAIMGGMPCIRGTRIPVATIAGMHADGMSLGEIALDLPQLDHEDVRAALAYAEAHPDLMTDDTITE